MQEQRSRAPHARTCMNFLQTVRISVFSVAENIITCFSCGVALKMSCTSLRMSARERARAGGGKLRRQSVEAGIVRRGEGRVRTHPEARGRHTDRERPTRPGQRGTHRERRGDER